MKYQALCTALTVIAFSSPILADETHRRLFTFEGEDVAERWQTVNDGVMGGRSVGRFKINDQDKMEFFGTLSLANNGGFASVRSTSGGLGLKQGDSIILRVRGDGRRYNLNLYTPRRLTAFSYRAEFSTKKDEWMEVAVPLDKFVATSFGRTLPNQMLDPARVNGLGISLSDKKAGPFQLEIDWISAGR